MLHFWRYVGHLLGIHPRWYPENFEQGVQVAYTALVKGVGQSGEDGALLSKSFIEAYAPNPEDSFMQRTRDYLHYHKLLGLTRFYISKEAFTIFDLPRNGLWRWWPLALAPYHFIKDTLRNLITPLDAWLDKKEQRLTRKWLDEKLGNRGAEYQVVETFTR